ncbi:MAG: peptidylprolyl isomerase [Nitrospinota bacterium]
MFLLKENWKGLALALVVLFSSGCSQKFIGPVGTEYVAIVNGYKISMEEFKRKLGKFHDVKNIAAKVDPGLATVDYFGILNSLIDERLMINEAKRLGFKGVPEYQTSHKYSKVNLALKLLKLDEVDGKVQVPDEEIEKLNKEKYETVEVWHLFTKSEEKAREFLKELKEGKPFESLVEERSEDPEPVRAAKGYIGPKRRNELAEQLRHVAFSLKEGEISGIISTWRGYHIIKVGKRTVPEIGYERRKGFYGKIFAERADAREQEFFDEIIKEYGVERNTAVLDQITLAQKTAKKEMDKGQVLATVGQEKILAGEVYDRLAVFDAKDEEQFEKGKKHILDGIIRQKILDMEIEKRDYYNDPRFLKEFAVTEDFLYLDFFKKIVIGVNAIVGKGEPLKYYESNQDKFRKPTRLKLRAILVTEKEHAAKIRADLDDGADFGITARDVSIDRSAKIKGDVGWVPIDEFPPTISSVLKEGGVGSISGPFKTNDGFLILKIDRREEGNLKSFANVRAQIGKKLADEKYQSTFMAYLNALRKDASVSVNEKYVQRYVDSKQKVKHVGRKNK